MKKHLFYFAVLILMPAQTALYAAEPEIIPVKNNLNKEKEFNLSEIASDIRFIQLETTDECLISGDSYIQYADNHVFVASDDHLYRFDDTGKFLNTIGRKGQGPGEFRLCFQFAINPTTRKVYILQDESMNEYEYNGTFIRNIPIQNHNVGAHSFLNSEQIVYSNSLFNQTDKTEADHLYTVQLSTGKNVGKIKTKFETKLRGVMHLGSFDFFYSFDENVYFKGNLQDEVYLIKSPKQKEVRWIFDLGNLKKEFTKREDIDPRNRLRGIQVQNMYETSGYLLFYYTHESKPYQGIYNKKEKSVVNAVDQHKEAGIINDLTGGPNLLLYPFQSHSKGIIVSPWRNPEYLIENKDKFLISNPRLPNRQEEWKQILNNLDEDSNPVVMLIYIKE